MNVGPLEIRNPTVLAAGVLGDSPTTLGAAYDAGAGAVVTKSLTVNPRPARPEPTVIRTRSGGILNSVGLANPGAAAFADQLGRPDFPVVVSLAGEPGDFALMAGLFKHAVGFELNLSCPNVRGMGELGDDAALVGVVVREVKSATVKPVFVKIAAHMGRSAVAAVDAGADGVTAINAVRATALDAGKPVFAEGGGLSGPPIREIALRAVHEAAKRKIPVMGCGGVSAWEDAADLMMVGASAVQVGAAAMADPAILGGIASGLAEWLDERSSGASPQRQAKKR